MSTHDLPESVNSAGHGIRYVSRLKTALNQFTGGLATPVRNPQRDKFGIAYECLIEADALRHREEVEAALEKYEMALSCRPDLTEALVGIGKCMRRKGDTRAAIDAFEEALSRNSFDKDVQLELAKCYTEAGELEKAISHYRRAIRLDPRYVDAMFGLALVLEIHDEVEESMALYKRIISEDPDFLPAYNNLGSLYMRLGLYAESESLFRVLTDKAPDFSRGFLGLAITLDKSQRKQESLAMYHQVLAMRPNARSGDFIRKRISQLSTELFRASARRQVPLARIK
ncbi:MAG: tetratricopeptide repeat protein [Candidatus Melainabacteria bacterium]